MCAAKRRIAPGGSCERGQPQGARPPGETLAGAGGAALVSVGGARLRAAGDRRDPRAGTPARSPGARRARRTDRVACARRSPRRGGKLRRLVRSRARDVAASIRARARRFARARPGDGGAPGALCEGRPQALGQRAPGLSAHDARVPVAAGGGRSEGHARRLRAHRARDRAGPRGPRQRLWRRGGRDPRAGGRARSFRTGGQASAGEGEIARRRMGRRARDLRTRRCERAAADRNPILNPSRPWCSSCRAGRDAAKE